MNATVTRTGVDVQSISRFREQPPELAARVRQRVFTERERAYCLDTRYPAQHFAARWAAKEAFVKAVGPVGYDAVELVREGQRPALALRDPASEVLGGLSPELDADDWSLDVSLSHDRDADAALAQVLAVPEVRPDA